MKSRITHFRPVSRGLGLILGIVLSATPLYSFSSSKFATSTGRFSSTLNFMISLRQAFPQLFPLPGMLRMKSGIAPTGDEGIGNRNQRLLLHGDVMDECGEMLTRMV
ncbi:MAG: hypothetical protein JRJ03_10025 [Deltaproteobacteria bacterium]|nr:hypothetical protein [Deltaproteobacteria bacterium]